ncbi:MAG: PAS domain S-box protein [Pedosphaera sp.]|nr:PAS domain S-box protein [Pedosphaera sp.]
MRPTTSHSNDAERLEVLERYQLLDSAPEPSFDDLTRLAARFCDAPIALITLVNQHRICFKSHLGFDLDETAREGFFCDHTIRQRGVLLVEDATQDARFASHPLVVGTPDLRAYAGAPLITPDGHAIGTLCVLDRSPRSFSADQSDALRVLAHQVITQMELHRNLSAVALKTVELRQAEAKYRDIFENVVEGIFQTTPSGQYLAANHMLARIYGYDSATELIESLQDISHQLYVAPTRRDEFVRLMSERGVITGFESEVHRRDGSIIWISENVRTVSDNQNRLLYYEGTVEEVTARKHQEQMLALGRDVGASLTQNELLPAALQGCCEAIVSRVGAAFARIWILDTAQQMLLLQASAGMYTHLDGPHGRVPVGQFKIGLIAQERKPHLTNQVSDDPRVSDQEWARREGMIAFAGYPLITGGRLLGVVALFARHALDHTLLDALHSLAGTIALAIERKQAEAALRKSELLYHSLVEALPQSIFRKDTESRFTFVNQFFCETVQRTSEKIIGKTDADLFPPELAAKYQRDDGRVMRTGITYQAIEAHAKPDGGTFYMLVIKSPLHNTDGEVIGIQGMFSDVTKSKKTEEELVADRALLRALMDNVPDRIYFKDTDSKFLLCNKALAERLGLKDPEEAIGKTDCDFHPPERAREFHEDEQRIILTGRPMVNKIEEQTALDGSRVWASVTKVPTHNRAGYLTGIIGISRDITALKRAEEELALTRDQALESARLKAQFLATMSHEIRTPMNGIIGMLDLLVSTQLKPEQHDFAETASHSAHALLEILNNILDLSKIEAGRLTLNQIDFDIREVVEDTVELLAPAAHGKEIEVSSFVPTTFPATLCGDPHRLRQVLLNLVGNAVKFTETGGVHLCVNGQSDSEGRFELRCEVRDTGIGITPEAQTKIFQAFIQADGSTTRRFGGTGLGLSICQQLVEIMGGQIGLESDPGRGSTFWFTVPLHSATPPAPTEPIAELKDLRVLFVAGDSFLREILHEYTLPAGIAATFATTGAEALIELQRAVQTDQPHRLVVFDLDLRDMEGLAFAQTIETDAALAGIRLVALTPINRRLEPEVVQAAGLSTCLLKPLKRARLLEGLARAMSSSTAEAIAAGTPAEPLTAPPTAVAATKSLRVLLAEDNPINQKVALLQLHRLGFDAQVAHHGREAIAALDQPFDVILMDCHMPELDGFDATRQIRAREQAGHWGSRRPIYIVALTADSLHDARDKCLAAGMNDYIKKPVQLAELEAAMQRARYHQPAPAQATRPADGGAIPTLDLATLESLRNLSEPGQPDLVTELVDLFIADVPPRLKKMQEAAADDDTVTVYAQSHTIKGSAGNLGAKAMAALCVAIERAAKTGTLAGTEEPIRELLAEYERVKDLLMKQRRV